MSTREDIENLIAKTALGNQAAFAELYSSTSSKLFGICLRILKDQGEAEEALQETFVKVWRSADKFATGNASPISWLAAIARNSAIDRYRKRRPESAEIEEAEVIADEAPTPEANTIISDDVRSMEVCLGELDERHSFAIKNVYLSGWSYQEASDALDVPLNTVKTWIRRGLISLRACLNR